MAKFTSAAPHIACFAILRDGDKVAFVLRSNTGWMDGYYGMPSGRVEWGEPFTVGAVREAEEEVGVKIKPEHLSHAITVHRHDVDSDWVDIYFEVEEWEGEMVNAEPDKHSEAVWLDMNNLPDNVIPAVRAALEASAAGENFQEYGW